VITARAFAGKHYAVFGLARSGLATVEALLASGAKVTAWDSNEDARAKLPDGAELADLDSADLSQFDSLVVTPGLPLNRHPIAQRARDAGVEIIGDIELFARARAELPPHKVVGITGTNGKSTTTALIHHILQTAGVPSAMGGNIGLPILAQDPLPEGGVYVLELSSYQLDLTQSLDCDVAVLLNITPDHLDRYESFEAYAASKAHLFEMQSAGRSAVIATNDRPTLRIAARLEERAKLFESTAASRQFAHASDMLLAHAREIRSGVFRVSKNTGLDQSHWPGLQGPHNAQNAATAIETCRILGLGESEIEGGLRTYSGLPHRMERVRERDGVSFINDSKATNPTATAPALAAFPAIRWICGGRPKSDDLDECAPHFGHVRSAYTIGEAAQLFERILKPHMPVKNCRELGEAVKAAAHDAERGDTVLLSPACASFDQFRDFEERGDQFRSQVEAL